MLGLALFGLAVLIRLPGLGRSLFYDERFTANHFTGSFLAAVLTQKQANNHPLASLLAWLATELLGRGDALALRAPSVLVGALAVVATGWLAGRRASAVVAVLAGLLALVHPAHVGFSQEVRGYALVLLFAPLATRLALDVLEGEARAVGLLAISVGLGVWAHATFLVLVLGLAVYLLFCKSVVPSDRRRGLAGVVGGAVMGLALLTPTLSHLGKFAEGHAGLSGESGGLPTPARLAAVVEMLSVADARLGAFVPLAVALGTLVGLAVVGSRRVARTRTSATVTATVSASDSHSDSVTVSLPPPRLEAAILTVLATTLAAWLAARPLFYARFFAFLLPLAIVLAARGAAVLARLLTGGREPRGLVLLCGAPLVLGWALATKERAGWETQPTGPALAFADEEAGGREGVQVVGVGWDLWPPTGGHFPQNGDARGLCSGLLFASKWQEGSHASKPPTVIVELFPERRLELCPNDGTTLADWERLYHVRDEVIREFPGLYSNVLVHRVR